MNNADFWASVRAIIAEGFTPEGLLKLDCSSTSEATKSRAMQNNSLVGSWFTNDFHRKNSMAAQREVQQMSLHPYSREQKIAQIQMLRRLSASSKESANAERSRKQP